MEPASEKSVIRAADSCGLASREITMTPNNFSNLVKIAPNVSKTERLFCPESPSRVASTIRAALKQVPDAATTHTNWCSFKRVLGALHLDVLVGRKLRAAPRIHRGTGRE